MDEIKEFIQTINKVYPDLTIAKVDTLNHQGQFNHIIIINHEFIFRFPIFEEDFPSLITEIRLLKIIKGFVSLPIPDPTYSSVQTHCNQKPFIGYRVIPGVPLFPSDLAAITDDQVLQKLADQLGIFLKELHTIPIDDSLESLSCQDGIDVWEKLYSEIHDNLFRFMRPKARLWVNNHFGMYFKTPHLQTYKACLRHGDFGPSNILYQINTLRISGILDFSSIGLGDPAVDIAAISCYGGDFLKRLYFTYPQIESMSERVQFHKGTFALQEALRGFKNNDQQAFEKGMHEYI